MSSRKTVITLFVTATLSLAASPLFAFSSGQQCQLDPNCCLNNGGCGTQNQQIKNPKADTVIRPNASSAAAATPQRMQH